MKEAEVATQTADAYSEVGKRIYGYVQTFSLKLYLPFSGHGGFPIQAVCDAAEVVRGYEGRRFPGQYPFTVHTEQGIVIQ